MFIDSNKYKNIILDLGNVILNIDYLLAVSAFKELGLNHFEIQFSQAQQQQLFDSYEKGQITSDEFRNELKKYCKKDTSNQAIDNAWNSMLLDLPAARLNLLTHLKQTHRTFLLSNTNEIHIDFFHHYLQKSFGIADLSSYFEKIYLSYKIGMRKPDNEIFEFILKENKLNPHETIFIDDSIQHIEAAKKLGIEAYWLDVKKESILEIFVIR
jgi:epoxide hydrolase-like predicted phosphatase